MSDAEPRPDEPISRDADTDKPVEPPTWALLHLWQIQPLRDVGVVLVIIGLLWLGQKISVVTVPVLLAIMLAYLFEPVIRWLDRRTRLERRGSVVTIIGLGVVLIVGPVILGLTFGVAQGIALAARLSQNVTLVNNYVEADEEAEVAAAHTELEGAGDAWVWIGERVRGEDDGDFAVIFERLHDWAELNANEHAQSAAGVGANLIHSIVTGIAATFGLLFMGFLTAFFFYFIATEWVQFRGFKLKLIPDKHETTVVHLAVKFDKVISGFVRGRLTIAFLQAIVFTAGYLIIGVPAAFILGPLVAILSIVPYMALVGLPVSILLLWLEDHSGIRGNWLWVILAPTAFYFIAQALDDYVWTPLIQGKETGMSTPMILFASLAGGVLFGVFGLLIAIPIAACLKIVIQEILWPRFKAWGEGEAEDFLPIGKR
jgi:predicted PurR-regulated permease PerM